MWGAGCRVWGVGCGVWGAGVRVSPTSPPPGVWGLELGVWVVGCRSVGRGLGLARLPRPPPVPEYRLSCLIYRGAAPQAHCNAGSPPAGSPPPEKLCASRIPGRPFALQRAKSRPLQIVVFRLPAAGPWVGVRKRFPQRQRSSVRRFKAADETKMTHTGQSRPDYGLRFQVKVLKLIQVVASPIGSGTGNLRSWWRLTPAAGPRRCPAHTQNTAPYPPNLQPDRHADERVGARERADELTVSRPDDLTASERRGNILKHV